MNRFRWTHLVAALAAMSLITSAFAQYAWVDEKGVKQYSDMPPPASVPKSRILKQPAQAEPAGERPAGSSNAAPSSATKEKAPMTSAERNADCQKRRAEQAEKEKKADEQARTAADKAKNCQRARDYQRGLESGERIAQTGGSGERAYLTDEQRARELRDVRRALDECK
jgi:hypothetical protein